MSGRRVEGREVVVKGEDGVGGGVVMVNADKSLGQLYDLVKAPNRRGVNELDTYGEKWVQ